MFFSFYLLLCETDFLNHPCTVRMNNAVLLFDLLILLSNILSKMFVSKV